MPISTIEVGCVSTSHISESTAHWLTEQSERLPELRDIDATDFAFGWWLYVHDEYGPNYPKDLCDVLDFCRSERVDYVRIERDGEVYDELPNFGSASST